MVKLRLAAAVAGAAVIMSAAPATALASPGTAPSWGSVGDLLPGNDNPQNKSKGCSVDWNSSAQMTSTDTTIRGGVSPARGDDGVTEVQLWGSPAAPHWRVVVAADHAIKDFTLKVTLPEGYTYTPSIEAADSNWFGVDKLDNRNEPVPWQKVLGPDDVTVDQAGRVTTVKIKDNVLDTNGRFVLNYTVTSPPSPVPASITTTARATGKYQNAKWCTGNGSSGNGSVGNLSLGSIFG